MTVFANGLEISCTAQANKVIAAFPDVCFTPPQTPATPPGVPVPYPSFGFDSDIKSGTGTVKIGGETISHKNKSYRKRTTGTEAGCAPKKNIITSVNTGKDYAHAWSPNVKADKEPISRFVDICTNDHSSPNAGSPPMSNMGAPGDPYATDEKCLCGPYSEIAGECNKRKSTGPDGEERSHEAHHIVPDRCYRNESKDEPESRTDGSPSYNDGINICLPMHKHRGNLKQNPDSVHGRLDRALSNLGKLVDTAASPANTATIGEVRKECIAALAALVPDTISLNCFKDAAKKVTEQTEGTKTHPTRTKKFQLAKGSDAQKLLQSFRV